MALDNVLKIYDEQGNPVDYDILASDVKFQDGKDLPTKLDELEEEIGEGGYTPPQGGIPATDLSSDVQTSLGKADSAYQKPASGIPASDIADGVIPDVSGLATKTELNGKVDKVTGKGLSTNDYTDADKAAVGTIGSKANDDVVVKSISVNGQNPQTPTQGNVNIVVQGADGITPQIGSNGHWFIGETDTGVAAQGPAGTSITDADLVIGNALNGQGDVLGMQGAMKLKNNIDLVQANLVKLYNKLANMAFWDAADQAAAQPTELDWSIPKHQLIVTNNNSNAKVYYKGAEVTSVLNIDENATVELVVAPVGDYVVSGVTPSTGTATDLGDGTFKVVLTMGQSDISLTLTVSTTAAYSITVNGHVTASGATVIVAGGTATVNLAADQDYTLPTDASGITISGATITSYTPSQDLSTAVLVIGSASGAVTIGVSAETVWSDCPTSDVMDGSTVIRYGIARGTCSPSGGIMNNTTNCPNVMMSPKPKTNSQAGDSAAYFFPTNGNGKVTVKATLPADLASNLYFGVDLVYYNSGFSFIHRDTHQYLNNGVTDVTFTIPSDIVANVSYIKILFALYKAGTDNTASSAAELDTLLAELDNGEYKFTMFN